jgi:tetratricopeptide (TPR) repeat protein
MLRTGLAVTVLAFICLIGGPLHAQSLLALHSTIKALTEYTNAIKSSREPSDYIRQLKAYIFLGYTAAAIDENYPSPTRTNRIVEAAAYFEEAILLYRKQSGDRLYGDVDDDEEKKLMYYTYLQRSHNLFKLNRAYEALADAEYAVSLSPHGPFEANALAIMGDTLLLLGDAKRAQGIFLRAMALKPQDLSLYRALVASHKFLGDLSDQEWLHLFETMEESLLLHEMNSSIIEDDSPATESYFINGLDLFSDSRFAPSEQSKKYILPTILVTPQDSAYGEYAIFQALFECAEMASLYEKAWYYLDRSKQITLEKLHAAGTEMPEEVLSRFKDSAKLVMSIFNRNTFLENTNLHIHSSSRFPIFIVGMLRSGSSLLETMLLSHSEVLTVGENSLFVSLVERYLGDKVDDWERLTQLLKTHSISDEFNKISDNFLMNMLNEALNLQNHTYDPSHLLSKQQMLPFTIKHVVDKMLFNFLNIGFIHLFFPNALIIHTVRDPLDTILSCYRTNFASNYSKMPQLSWTLKLETLYHAFRTYLEVMAYFNKILPTARIYEVQYEHLIKNPEIELSRILVKVILFCSHSDIFVG